MNFDQIRDQIKSRDVDPADYESAYFDLIARIENVLPARPRDDWGNLKAIREYALVLRQVHLHRAIKLFEGAVNALILDNGYSMILSIRGHFETTAAIGYLHNRLASLKMGNLTPIAIDKDIFTQLLGTRDEHILKNVGENRNLAEAKQVLNLLEYADKSVSKHILKGTTKEHTMLMDSYTFLCEFSHPNFHSNTLSFALDKEKREVRFKYGSRLSSNMAKIIEHILISTQIFRALYDGVETLLP